MRIRSLFVVSFLLLPALAFGQSLRQDMVVSPEWLAAKAGNVIILDIGTAQEFAKGHIPGARLVELSSLVTDRDGRLNELPAVAVLESVLSAAGVGDRKRIVLYSRDPIPAARAWFTLDYLGQGSRTSYLDGGFARWSGENRPVTTDPAPAEAAEFHAGVRAAGVMGIKAMRPLVKFRDVLAPDIVMIDARSPEQYCGKEAAAGVLRGGHIPGAINITWSENLMAGGIPRLLPERELRALYAGAGVTTKSTNVVYCRTGMQASVNYMVLRYLGYEVSLYDGSFSEWSSEGDTLVADVRSHTATGL